jgi:hypothetical protein
MTPRYPYVPSWEPQTSICDILKVFPTVGAELERLGIPPTAVHDCITVSQVASRVGWNPYTLLNFLIPPPNLVPSPKSESTDFGNHQDSCVGLLQILRAEHVRILGGYIHPIRELWSRWESEGFPPEFPLLSTQREEFEILCAEISCHFLLEEEELFPYVTELHRACSAQISQHVAFQILRNKSLTDDGEIIGLVDLFENLLSRFPEDFKPPSGDSVSGDTSSGDSSSGGSSSGDSSSGDSASGQNIARTRHISQNQPTNHFSGNTILNKDRDFGRNLWDMLLAFKESWIRHEACETEELFPRILELENHLLRKN